MSIGGLETGGLVAFASLFTIIITKIKCYYKNPNSHVDIWIKRI